MICEQEVATPLELLRRKPLLGVAGPEQPAVPSENLFRKPPHPDDEHGRALPSSLNTTKLVFYRSLDL